MRTILATLLGIMTITSQALAGDLPVAPPSPPVDSLGAPSVSAKFSQTFTLGALKSNIAHTGLNDLRNRVGGGVIEAMQSISWLCYDLPQRGQRVWLSSDTQQGAFIDTVTVTRIGTASSRCPVLPAKFQAVVIDTDLRLGMTRADLTKRLGKPSRQVETWVVYSSSAPASNDTSDTGLAVQFVNDRAVFISAVRIAGH